MQHHQFEARDAPRAAAHDPKPDEPNTLRALRPLLMAVMLFSAVATIAREAPGAPDDAAAAAPPTISAELLRRTNGEGNSAVDGRSVGGAPPLPHESQSGGVGAGGARGGRLPNGTKIMFTKQTVNSLDAVADGAFVERNFGLAFETETEASAEDARCATRAQATGLGEWLTHFFTSHVTAEGRVSVREWIDYWNEVCARPRRRPTSAPRSVPPPRRGRRRSPNDEQTPCRHTGRLFRGCGVRRGRAEGGRPRWCPLLGSDVLSPRRAARACGA